MQVFPRFKTTLLLSAMSLTFAFGAHAQEVTQPAAKETAENPKQEATQKPTPEAAKPDAASADSAAKTETLPQAAEAEKTPPPPPPPSTTVLRQPENIVDAGTLLTPPAPPKGKISFIGGSVDKIDQIRNRMNVRIFGGGKMRMFFDERSHFYRDGVETTQIAIKKGDRIYVDSQLDQGKIFARNVRVQTGKPMAAASGHVAAFNPRSGDLTLLEPISAKPLNFRVTNATIFKSGTGPGSVSDLQKNAIVKVSFLPSSSGRAQLSEVELVAVPGTRFTFFGTLTHLDLRSGLLALENKSDSRLYEVKFRPNAETVTEDLVIGAEVSVIAQFTGKDYTAESVKVTRTAQAVKSSDDEVK